MEEFIPYVKKYLQWIESEKSIKLGEKLKNSLSWEQHMIVLYGKPIDQPRLIYACGENGLVHSYSGLSLPVNDWNNPELKQIKKVAIKLTKQFNVPFNSCLLNYYRNGLNYISYHSDKETSKSYNQVVTISLGTSRDFAFKTKKEPFKRFVAHLNSGDLVYMYGKCQELYTHSLLKRTESIDWRISLTFRVLDPPIKEKSKVNKIN
jgi:alkylated DNA repair dioxygenase AlkB